MALLEAKGEQLRQLLFAAEAVDKSQDVWMAQVSNCALHACIMLARTATEACRILASCLMAACLSYVYLSECSLIALEFILQDRWLHFQSFLMHHTVSDACAWQHAQHLWETCQQRLTCLMLSGLDSRCGALVSSRLPCSRARAVFRCLASVSSSVIAASLIAASVTGYCLLQH